VKGKTASWVRLVSLGLALIVGLTIMAPPAAAADSGSTATATRPGLSVATSAAVLKTPKPLFTQQSAPPASTSSDHGFFGTAKGRIALVLFAAGAGWAIYSTKHDRDPVKSPIR
jgi:hypothetical protein